MACSCDTQTVLEMLFDIDTDNGINTIEYAATQIAIVVVVISCANEVRNYAFTFQYT